MLKRTASRSCDKHNQFSQQSYDLRLLLKKKVAGQIASFEISSTQIWLTESGAHRMLLICEGGRIYTLANLSSIKRTGTRAHTSTSG